MINTQLLHIKLTD